ncbi:hypothetical protein NKG94_26025 [Micromonospora sp. M12]
MSTLASTQPARPSPTSATAPERAAPTGASARPRRTGRCRPRRHPRRRPGRRLLRPGRGARPRTDDRGGRPGRR